MIKNIKDGKIYIGQTVDYFRRMNEYKNRKASKSKSSKYGIMEAIEKYGFNSFEYSIIKECKKEELDYYEMYYIDKYKSYIKSKGYNSFHLDKNNKKRVSKSTKNKMRKAHVGLKETVTTKRKKSNVIYAINNHDFIICDSAKLFGDHIGKSKDYIKSCLRNPTFTKGYYFYYADRSKREEIKNVVLKKKNKDFYKSYLELLEYLDNSSVETIERDYNIIYIKYES